MYVLAVLDHGAPADALERTVDCLVDHLTSRGRVGVVRYDATIADGTASVHGDLTVGGDVTYALGADGDWAATGTDLSVDDALASLAPACQYAVLVGVDSVSTPAVVVADERDGASGVSDTDEADADADSGDSGSDAAAYEVVASVTAPGDLDLDTLTDRLERSEPFVTLESLVEQVTASPRAERAGAVATFTGRVRERDGPDDVATTHLEFESYDEVATERMAAIEQDLESRDGVYAVELHHRTGVVEAGEDIVFVVVLAGHREEAFRTVEDGINRLKAEVPLFKKEVTVEDTFWVHDRE